jgi:AraC-like DNA-binding protein
MPEILAIAKRYDLRIRRLHSHVGSGTDPEVWKRCARMTLDLAGQLPEVVVELPANRALRRVVDLPMAAAENLREVRVGVIARTVTPDSQLQNAKPNALYTVPSIDDVAQRLATSSRTLRRRLEESGTSFRELLDGTRAELARSYVRDRRMPLVTVGTALAFVTLAIPVQLESNWITIAWSVEALLMLWAGLETSARRLRALRHVGVVAGRAERHPPTAPRTAAGCARLPCLLAGPGRSADERRLAKARQGARPARWKPRARAAERDHRRHGRQGRPDNSDRRREHPHRRDCGRARRARPGRRSAACRVVRRQRLREADRRHAAR